MMTKQKADVKWIGFQSMSLKWVFLFDCSCSLSYYDINSKVVLWFIAWLLNIFVWKVDSVLLKINQTKEKFEK